MNLKCILVVLPYISYLKKIFNRGVEVLQGGVTERFEASIVELKQKSLINKGILSIPKGKSLITQKEYDLEKLKKLEKEIKVIKTKTTAVKPTDKVSTIKVNSAPSTAKSDKRLIKSKASIATNTKKSKK